MVAEWLFWDEFGTRFNFIAVDYLVYGTEVSHNMYESYPVVYLLSGIFAASLCTIICKELSEGPLFYRGKVPQKAVHHGVDYLLRRMFYFVGQALEGFFSE